MTNRQGLTQSVEETVRSLRIIILALAAGVFLFACVIGYIYLSQPAEDSPGSGNILTMLSYLHVGMVLLMWPTAFVLNGIIQRKAIKAEANLGLPEEDLSYPLQGILGGTIVQMSMIEGPAIFGLVICMIGTMDGALHASPIYWANALSAVVFLLLAITSLPSVESVRERIRQLRHES